MAETKIKSSGLSANLSVSNLSLTGTTSVSGNIIPTSNNAINLGTPTMRFGSLYLSGNTIDLGGAQITTTASGDLSFNTASGNVAITANTVSFLTTVANTVSDPGNVSFDSNVRATAVVADAYFYSNGTPFTGGGGGGSATLTSTVYTPGSLFTGYSAQYSARWYPNRVITVNSITGRLITAGTVPVQLNININDVAVRTLTITGLGPNISANSFSTTSTDDYITVTVSNDGAYASDLYVSFNYT